MKLLFDLFYTFFKIGLFTFGGGYAMLPLIQDEVVRHGWLSIAELVDFVAVSESTPGPFAINISTYVGVETAGVLGALAATMGVVLPSFFVILAVARFYVRFKSSRAVSGVMYGLRAAVVGLLASALWGDASDGVLPQRRYRVARGADAGILVYFGHFCRRGYRGVEKSQPYYYYRMLRCAGHRLRPDFFAVTQVPAQRHPIGGGARKG